MNHTAEVFQPLQDDDPRTVAGYRLAARLGAGGMGRVYLSHTRGGRPVAIKVVRSELADDPTFRRRFAREVKAARKVKGAYTAELIDADPDGAPPWLATLYVPGPSLSEAVARSGSLPVPAVLWLMAGVAEALQAIHGAGIVHRDLKPSNVLLAPDGPRVIDFGISLAADSTAHTVTGTTIGTPQYMAPEQASAGAITVATDVFALGQTAAFAALGRPLYGDGPAATVLYRIVHSEPDLSGLPERLRHLLGRCLASDAEERATPVEIIEWCRRELGRDAREREGEEAGPTVWREIAGPEVTVPSPPRDPTAAHTRPLTETRPTTPPAAGTTAVAQSPATGQAQAAPHAWVAPHTSPTAQDSAGVSQTSVAVPQTSALPRWPAGPQGPTVPQPPAGSDARRTRRRRAVLSAAAALAAAGLLIPAAWMLRDAMGRSHDRDRDAAASASGTPGSAEPRSSASGAAATEGVAAGDGSEDGAGTAADPGTGSTSDAQGASTDGPAAGPTTPQARGYSGVTVDSENSIALSDGKNRKGSEGDIRFGCSQAGCELESDTSVFTVIYGEPGTTYDDCRLLTASQKSHSVPLAAVAAGTEICVRHRNGDIALLVLQVKSTAMPDLGFVMADLTVWRAG